MAAALDKPLYLKGETYGPEGQRCEEDGKRLSLYGGSHPPADYDRIKDGDMLIVEDIQGVLGKVVNVVNVRNVTQAATYTVKCDLKARQRAIVQAGGLLNYTKMGSKV